VVAGIPAKRLKRVDELVCFNGLYNRPYEWPPYGEAIGIEKGG
jgi:hypothetical protein